MEAQETKVELCGIIDNPQDSKQLSPMVINGGIWNGTATVWLSKPKVS